MGKKDAAVKNWLSDKLRFTDLFNGVCFNGAQIIKPEKLVELNGESKLVFRDKTGLLKSLQRYRDKVMLWNGIILRLVLAVELQDKVHYGMPVRNMIMDGLSYTEQMREIWSGIPEEEKKELIGSDDYFSQFGKEDKLYPVITLVFYWGDDWDGNMDLYDMFDLEDVKNDVNIMDTLKKYVPNYRINLVHPARTEDLSVFKTDLQKMFGVLQLRDKTENLLRYMNDNRDYFSCMDYDSYNAFEVLLGTKRLLKNNKKKTREGNDMCKALEDWYNDGRNKGMEQGRSEGIKQGRSEGIKQGRSEGIKQGRIEGLSIFITTLRELNHTEEQIREQLIKKYNLTSEEANKRMQECA